MCIFISFYMIVCEHADKILYLFFCCTDTNTRIPHPLVSLPVMASCLPTYLFSSIILIQIAGSIHPLVSLPVIVSCLSTYLYSSVVLIQRAGSIHPLFSLPIVARYLSMYDFPLFSWYWYAMCLTCYIITSYIYFYFPVSFFFSLDYTEITSHSVSLIDSLFNHDYFTQFNFYSNLFFLM